MKRLAYCLLLVLGGCQTLSASQPATVNLGDSLTKAVVVATLSKAVGRVHITLGPSDEDRVSTLAVLPAPLGPHETHSVAMPTYFDIIKRGESCFAVERQSQKAYPLTGVKCE